MLQKTHQIVHRPGRVFETLGFDEHWAQGGYEDGHEVDDSTPFESMLVEFAFVLPRLSPVEPGRYPILTVARDRKAKSASGRRGGGSTADGATHDVFLHLCYEPSEDRFLISVNLGTPRRSFETFALEGAFVASYTRRVLSGTFLITRRGIFPSIDDPLTGQRELFGDVRLSGLRKTPWGEPRRGTWRIRSGAESAHDDEERSFPGGFGLSDLRVTLLGAEDRGPATLAYSGELDHLASGAWASVNPYGSADSWIDDWSVEDWALEDWDIESWAQIDDVPMSTLLHDLADQLHVLSGGFSSWAGRARGLAEETQQWARGFQDDEGDDTYEEIDGYVL